MQWNTDIKAPSQTLESQSRSQKATNTAWDVSLPPHVHSQGSQSTCEGQGGNKCVHSACCPAFPHLCDSLQACPHYLCFCWCTFRVNPWKYYCWVKSCLKFSLFWLHLGTWNVHDQQLNLWPLQWKHGVLTTGPPGESLNSILISLILIRGTNCPLKGLQQIESQDYTVACFEGFKFITYLNSSFFKDAKDFFTIYFMFSIRSTLQATDRYLTKYFWAIINITRI